MRQSIQRQEEKRPNGRSSFFKKESAIPFFSQRTNSINPYFVQSLPFSNSDSELNSSAEAMVETLSTPVIGRTMSSPGVVQRKCKECEKEEENIQRKGIPGTESKGPEALPEPGVVPAARLIVEDNVNPEPNQKRKSEFLAILKQELCTTVNQALVGTPYSSDNCPYLQAAFEKHRNSNPNQLEQLIIRYEPTIANAVTADDMIARMKVRVFSTAKSWAQSQGSLGGIMDIFGGVMNKADNAMSGLFFKANPGGPNTNHSPGSVLQNLDSGRSIDSHTRGSMEPAFGSSFSDVEIHTGQKAARLTENMNARALTVGNHIAFASGEYQPGTLIGDALMAHELAHVIQQRDAGSTMAEKSTHQNLNNAFEEDADISAINAVYTGWSKGDKGRNRIPKTAMPKLRSGLSLQSCKTTVKQCPKGLQWSVVGQPDPKKPPGTIGAGPVCICIWRCMPPGVGFSNSGVSGEGGYYSGPAVDCQNKWRGKCPGDKEYVSVEDDHEFQSTGDVMAIGAHLTPVSGTHACGCLPLNIEGDPSGQTKTEAPLMPVGMSVTDFVGLGGRKNARYTPPATTDPKARPAIIEPKVPVTKPPVPSQPPAKLPTTTTPPVTAPPPVTTTPPVKTPPVTTPPPVTTTPPVTTPPVTSPAPVTTPPKAPPTATPPVSTTPPVTTPPAPTVTPPAKTPPVTTTPPAPAKPPGKRVVVTVPPKPADAPAKPAATPPAKDKAPTTTKPSTTPTTVPPVPSTTPTVPPPIAAGETVTVPYKKGNARATVVEVGADTITVLIKTKKGDTGNIKHTMQRAEFDAWLKSGQAIRWTQERERLMANRPPYEPGLVEKVWLRAQKESPDGIVRDPNTKEVLTWDRTKSRDGQWDMGHKKGKKYSELVDSYVNGKISMSEFMKEYNNIDNYHPESPAANRSHQHE